MSDSVWDRKLGDMERGKLDRYTNIKSLFQAIPDMPGSAVIGEISNKLKESLTSKVFGVPTGVNDKFARALNEGLREPGIRERIVQLVREAPAALGAAIDRIRAEPARTAEIIRDIQLPERTASAEDAVREFLSTSKVTSVASAPGLLDNVARTLGAPMPAAERFDAAGQRAAQAAPEGPAQRAALPLPSPA